MELNHVNNNYHQHQHNHQNGTKLVNNRQSSIGTVQSKRRSSITSAIDITSVDQKIPKNDCNCLSIVNCIENTFDTDYGTKEKKKNVSMCPLLFETCAKIIIGLILGSIVCFSWLTMNLFLHLSINDLNSNVTLGNILEPRVHTHNDDELCICFLLVWLSSCCLIILYPIYFLTKLCCGSDLKKGTMINFVKTSLEIFNTKKSTTDHKAYLKDLLVKLIIVTILWISTGYFYIKTLDLIKFSESIYLFSLNVPCAYIISWIALKKQFVSVKLFGFMLSLSCAIFVVFHNGFYFSMKFLGCLLGCLAGLGMALLRLLFDYMHLKKEWKHLLMLLSIIGLFSSVFFWPIIVIFHFTNVERVDFIWNRDYMAISDIRVSFILGAYVSAFVYVLVKRYGTCYTYELFIRLGCLVTIPLAMALDNILFKSDLEIFEILAFTCVCTSYLLFMIPIDCNKRLQSCYSKDLAFDDTAQEGAYSLQRKYRKNTLANISIF